MTTQPGIDFGDTPGFVDGFGGIYRVTTPGVDISIRSDAKTPPTVSNLVPANGEPIYPDTPIQFDVTDTDDFAVIIPMITLDPFRLPEPTARGVTDDDFAFEPLYQAGGSVRLRLTATSYRYTLRRKGGWTATPQLRIWAVDLNGAVWIGP